MSKNSLEQLNLKLREFAVARDWEQFQSPKNLSMALIVEAAELVEHFQWMTEEQSYIDDPSKLDEVRYEMADIFIYLLRISDRLNIDLLASAEEKMVINERRYPAEKVKGSTRKYTDFN